jgi:hypothetical protein
VLLFLNIFCVSKVPYRIFVFPETWNCLQQFLINYLKMFRLLGKESKVGKNLHLFFSVLWKCHSIIFWLCLEVNCKSHCCLLRTFCFFLLAFPHHLSSHHSTPTQHLQ